MSKDEAIEWLKGNRSTTNSFSWIDNNDIVLCAKADSAMTQQAYFIVKAHKEGLIKEGAET